MGCGRGGAVRVSSEDLGADLTVFPRPVTPGLRGLQRQASALDFATHSVVEQCRQVEVSLDRSHQRHRRNRGCLRHREGEVAIPRHPENQTVTVRLVGPTPNYCMSTCSFLRVVGRVGLEPTTKGFRFVPISGLPGLCLRHSQQACRRAPSSLYTFPQMRAWLGVALRFAAVRFHRL